MPDANPKYQREPRPESIEVFRKYVAAKSVVSKVEHIGGLNYAVIRPKLGDLRVFLTNLYIVGEADVHQISSDESGLNAIVTMSNWNSYTHEAKQVAREQGIGLFKFSEFMGAIFYADQRFLDYVPPQR